MTLKPSDLVGKSSTQPQPAQQQASPKGCLTFVGYGVLFLFLAPLAIGSGGMASEFVPSWLMWLTFLAVLSVPLLIQFKFQKKWRKRNLFATFFLTYTIIMGITQSFFTNTEAYRQYQIRKTQYEVQESANEAPPVEVSTTSETIYTIGTPFTVGYTQYVVRGIQWRESLGDSSFGGQAAGARYLLVTVQVKNVDKESRMVPPFHLVDENGAKYDQSPDSGLDLEVMENDLLLTSLNPGVQKTGIIVFDVPPEHQYQLVVSGGFWSHEETKVTLN